MKNRWMPVCGGCFRQLIVSPRCLVVMIVTALYLDNLITPIRAAMQGFQTRVSIPGLMSFMLNDAHVTSFMALACLALMFDLPAADELQRYLMLRTGRRSWAKGQVAYGFCIAVFYLLAFILITWLMLLPCVEYSAGWSRGVEMLMTNETDCSIYFDIWLPRAYSALTALGLQCGLRVLLLTLLGMLLMNVNMLVDRRLGFFVLAVPIGLDMLLEEYFSEKINYFSPLTLCRLSGLDYGDGMGRPSVWFAAAVLAAGSILLGWLFVFCIRRREVRL